MILHYFIYRNLQSINASVYWFEYIIMEAKETSPTSDLGQIPNLSQPMIPSSSVASAQTSGQYLFYNELTHIAPSLYPVMLLNFLSAEVRIEKRKKGMIKIKDVEVPEYESVPTFRRLPDGKRRCEVCQVIKNEDDVDWEACKGTIETPHELVETKFINYRPIFTPVGFSQIAGTILSFLTPNITTGNLPIEEKKIFKKKVIALAHNIDEILYIHESTYINPDIYLSVPMREAIEQLIIDNILSFASGGLGGHNIDRMTKQTTVQETISQSQPSKQAAQGVVGRFKNWVYST